MADKKITTVDTIDTLPEDGSVFVSDGTNIMQISKQNAKKTLGIDELNETLDNKKNFLPKENIGSNPYLENITDYSDVDIDVSGEYSNVLTFNKTADNEPFAIIPVKSGIVAETKQVYLSFDIKTTKERVLLDAYTYKGTSLKNGGSFDIYANENFTRRSILIGYHTDVDNIKLFIKTSAINSGEFDLEVKNFIISENTYDGVFNEFEELQNDVSQLQLPTHPLKNVKIDIIGDSLSDVSGTASIKYHALLTSKDGADVNVLAKNGSGYFNGSTGDLYHFYKQALNVRSDSNIVFVFGSFNDISKLYNGNVQIGNITDNTTDTICGCINQTIDNILSKNISAKILFATPTPWQGMNAHISTGNPYHDSVLNYVKAIKDVCDYRGYECKDFFRNSNLKPWIEQFRTLYYYEADGTHPNNLGHEKYLYPIVKHYLESV